MNKMQEKFKRYFDGLWSLEKILVKLIIVGLIVPALLALRFEMMQIDNKNLANDENGRLDLATDARFRRAMAEIKKDSSTLEADRLELVANQMASEKEYIEEMQGGTGSPGYGPRAKQLGELRNSKTQQLIDYDAKMKILMDNLIARREQLISQHDEELTRNKMMADKHDDLFQPSYITNKIINSPLNIFYTIVMSIVIYAYVNFIITSRVRKQPIQFKDSFWFIIPPAILIYGCLFLINL
jgi:hypothetical protein